MEEQKRSMLSEKEGLSHAKSAELIQQIIKFLAEEGLHDTEISTVLYRAYRAFYCFVDEQPLLELNLTPEKLEQLLTQAALSERRLLRNRFSSEKETVGEYLNIYYDTAKMLELRLEAVA
jgi:hypothetical protein